MILHGAWWIAPLPIHLKLNDTLEVKSSLLPSFCFSYLCCFWLYLRVDFPAFSVFVRSVAPYPCCFLCLQGLCCLDSARATVITGIVGSPLVPRIPWFASCTMGEGSQWGKRQDQTSASTLSGVRFVVSTSADGGLGARVVCLRNWRNGVPVPTAMAPITCNPWEARVLCTAFPVDIGFSKDTDSSAVFRGLDYKHQLPCSSGSASSPCSTIWTFRHTDVCNSLASCCVGQKHLKLWML